MSKPYDSAFKDLLERNPAGWVRLALGEVDGEPTLVDSDISTVSGAADKVVRVEGLSPSVVHFEAFASWDPTILARALHYNGAHHATLPIAPLTDAATDRLPGILRRWSDASNPKLRRRNAKTSGPTRSACWACVIPAIPWHDFSEEYQRRPARAGRGRGYNWQWICRRARPAPRR